MFQCFAILSVPPCYFSASATVSFDMAIKMALYVADPVKFRVLATNWALNVADVGLRYRPRSSLKADARKSREKLASQP